jgi:hypothetical protein
MNDRLVTLLGALASLLILFLLLYSPRQGPVISLPTSEQQGENGYLGLKRWLDFSGVTTVSYRQRMLALTENAELAASGNVMISTMPHTKPFSEAELLELNLWLSRGNTLLLLAALDDSPAWILTMNTLSFLDEIAALTGLSFDTVADEEGEVILLGELFDESGLSLEPVTGHPLMSGVHTLEGVSDSVTSIWRPRLFEDSRFVAQLATEIETGAGAMWQLPVGEGFLILGASASLLSNRMLDQADNARFLTNLLTYHLGPAGAFIFDDMHQGLTDVYDPEAFFADDRLHVSLWFIVGFWLIYLLGTSSRLQPVTDQAPPPRQSDLVKAIGGFMTRKLGRSEAGRLLVEGWFEELERTGRINAEAGTPWQQLESMPLVRPTVLDSVRLSYARLGRGEKVDLKKLHNQLLELKRILA